MSADTQQLYLQVSTIACYCKSVFHLTVGHFMGLDGFEESIADVSQGDSINIITNGIEGCGDHVG
jgi:hypothetical protein